MICAHYTSTKLKKEESLFFQTFCSVYMWTHGIFYSLIYIKYASLHSYVGEYKGEQ